MDSSGLTLLLGVIDQVAEVELRDPPAMIRQLIHITGLTHLFVITHKRPKQIRSARYQQASLIAVRPTGSPGSEA